MAGDKKITNAELDERVSIIFELLCKGVTSHEIFQYVSKNYEWNVSERQLYNYLGKANEKFKELSEKHKDIEFGKSVTRLNLLFYRSLKIQDYKTCLQIQKEIGLLFGLNEPTKTENNVNLKDELSGVDYSKLSDATLKEIANATKSD